MTSTASESLTTQAKLDMSLEDISKTDQKEKKESKKSNDKPQRYNSKMDTGLMGSSFQMNSQFAAMTPTIMQELRKVIKVSSKSDVKRVAGAIAHTTRAGESPTLMATGIESVNQAVKAIAIARGFLGENKLDVYCQPVFRSQEKSAISFVLTKTALRAKKQDDAEEKQLHVAHESKANKLAGSIAKKVRSGERVIIQAIGAASVAVTVRAITMARRFLEQNAVDISFRPEFIHVKLDEGERSAVKFTILAQQV
eukprot:TRINITY_DN85_c0_g1_i2.p1 TRINITY_DN85_c0_g1~~TRINITY_DN85_c0_g1_i2.p1  ORF type:complete len:254 (+),score=80.36 TRINITY_DN85_c0_g1_i2:143-904(+)